MSKITSYNNNVPIYSEEKTLEYIEVLKKFLKNKLKKANATGFIVGISGGIDSALTYSLAKLVAPNTTIGVVMPISSMSDYDLKHISELEKTFGQEFIKVDLSSVFEAQLKQLNISNKLAIANIKPRLRMTTLYALAQENNSLVLGTDNADEVYIGYFTKYGDGGADLLPISRLTKGEVNFMAKILGVPESILNKKPSAGLWEGQNDEDELGFSYLELDYYINHLNDKDKINSYIKDESIEKIKHKHKISKHKRDGAYKPNNIK
ncbi:NAD(+) synthase [Mycoplasma sp. CSL7503-lung]|uniref:NAD(+) synthase n=1 Tax=Mycoplasma sp. CSL7503-lung TaxID=536372 RepID=UPI0021CFC928|nr:NAD(+) synthase [Mycoplasma sp. CSL7503-lung]MCU4706829.1 NAD(+) synthase [Mycoplasma sp. CSL7503-lung]